MKITIIGAGAIGGLAGAYMTEAGHDVTLVDRWEEHIRTLQDSGLSIDGVRGKKHVRVKACLPQDLEAPLEAVLIATKSQHTEDAVRQILPLLGADGFIVSYQNGFNEVRIAELLTEAGMGGAERVVGSIPNYGGALVDPGFIEFVHEGPIQLGEISGSVSDRVRQLAGMLEALTEVQLSDNIWGQVWAKEVYSAQVVFSALANAPVRETLGVERYARIAGAVVQGGARDRRGERHRGGSRSISSTRRTTSRRRRRTPNDCWTTSTTPSGSSRRTRTRSPTTSSRRRVRASGGTSSTASELRKWVPATAS